MKALTAVLREAPRYSRAYAGVLALGALEYTYSFHIHPGERKADYVLFAVIAVYLLQRLVIRRPLSVVGLPENAKAFRRGVLLGVAAGFALAGAALACGFLSGGISLNVYHSKVFDLLAGFTYLKLGFSAAAVAFGLELVYRGFMNGALSSVHPPLAAYAVSSVVYGLSGVILRDFGGALFVNLFLFGLAMSLLRERRGNLYLPAGAHTAWLWAWIIAQPLVSAQRPQFAVANWWATGPLGLAAAWLLYLHVRAGFKRA